MMPLKSKKDEIVAKSLYMAKESMKKINHPLTGFMMGEEGSSYAVQLNTTDVATPKNSNKNNSTADPLIAHLQMEVKDHNETVKGAIVNFAKSMGKLHNSEVATAAKPAAATKVEEVKKDAVATPAAVKKVSEPTKDQKATAPPKAEEKKEVKK
jgi:hypothetical protein